MSDQVKRDCLCGGSLRAKSTPAEAAAGVAGAFDLMHSGDGHGRATPEQSARARAAQERNPDPGDGRVWCAGCERWKFLAIHSCPGVPQSSFRLLRSVGGGEDTP